MRTAICIIALVLVVAAGLFAAVLIAGDYHRDVTGAEIERADEAVAEINITNGGIAMTSTSRTLALLREKGMMCQTVEKWVKFGDKGGCRKDLYGIIDALAVSPERGILGVQVCDMSGRTAHIEKLTVEMRENSITWLRSGGKLEVHAWRKLKLKRGGKAVRWTVEVTEITLDMMGAER